MERYAVMRRSMLDMKLNYSSCKRHTDQRYLQFTPLWGRKASPELNLEGDSCSSTFCVRVCVRVWFVVVVVCVCVGGGGGGAAARHRSVWDLQFG